VSSHDLAVEYADSIRDLDESGWDALAADQIVMSHRWQRVMEASLADYRPRYVLARDPRGPLLGLVANTVEPFGRRGWREAVLKRLSIVVAAPYSSQHCGVMVRPGTAVSDVLPTVEWLLARLCWHEQRLLVGVANVPDHAVDHWRARGFAARAQSATMELDLPGTYLEYLARLSARDRGELRRIRRRAADHGAMVAHGPLRGTDGHLFEMLAEVCERHTHTHTPAARAPRFTAALFPSLAREMGGDAVVFFGTVNGQPAGYFTCFVQGRTLVATLAGLRYDRARPSALYFLLIDEMIQWSVRHGIQRIQAGLSNEPQKRRHGFTPRRRWFCFRAYPGVLNRALGATHPARGH
jgi:predicted N-acyltransferase